MAQTASRDAARKEERRVAAEREKAVGRSTQAKLAALDEGRAPWLQPERERRGAKRETRWLDY